MLITKFCLEIIYSKLQLHIIESNELRLFDDDVIKCKHLPRYWPFVREFTAHRWIPLTKASDAELWCFLWSAPEHTIKQTIVTPGDLRCNRTHYDIIVMAMDVHVPVSQYIYIYIYTYICVYVCVRVCVRVHMWICVCYVMRVFTMHMNWLWENDTAQNKETGGFPTVLNLQSIAKWFLMLYVWCVRRLVWQFSHSRVSMVVADQQPSISMTS